ncbi:MAG: DUF423 domain-containing protein [Planctomycetes bacterium]|nr:DUF423 domain-containing protein [Planctomycetota bacterium]
MSASRWLLLGAIFGGLSVGLGAFAAHGIDKVFVEKYAGLTRVVAGETIPLSKKFLNDFKTAAEYQMYHSLALLVVGLLAQRRLTSCLTIAGVSFTLGIVLFSGSLYILTLTGVTKWGMVTPLGGVAFLVGWCALATHAALGPDRHATSPTETPR